MYAIIEPALAHSKIRIRALKTINKTRSFLFHPLYGKGFCTKTKFKTSTYRSYQFEISAFIEISFPICLYAESAVIATFVAKNLCLKNHPRPVATKAVIAALKVQNKTQLTSEMENIWLLSKNRGILQRHFSPKKMKIHKVASFKQSSVNKPGTELAAK